MIEYIKNIIPRIKSYSVKVDKEELLIGKTWVWVGFDQGYTTFHFLRDNRLLISQLGNVQEGKWEFIGNNQLLNIKGEGFNVLLNHGILFEGVLIMQKQGVLDNFEVLYDEQVIPDGDIVGYIESKIPAIIKPLEDLIVQSIYPLTVLINDSELTFYKEPSIGDKVISQIPFNGKINNLYDFTGVDIENSIIKRVFKFAILNTDKGTIEIEVGNLNHPKGIGSFRDDSVLPHGYYNIKYTEPFLTWKSIKFKNGKILKTSSLSKEQHNILMIFALIGTIVYFSAIIYSYIHSL